VFPISTGTDELDLLNVLYNSKSLVREGNAVLCKNAPFTHDRNN
jgi:hypothetical protein